MVGAVSNNKGGVSNRARVRSLLKLCLNKYKFRVLNISVRFEGKKSKLTAICVFKFNKTRGGDIIRIAGYLFEDKVSSGVYFPVLSDTIAKSKGKHTLLERSSKAILFVYLKLLKDFRLEDLKTHIRNFNEAFNTVDSYFGDKSGSFTNHIKNSFVKTLKQEFRGVKVVK